MYEVLFFSFVKINRLGEIIMLERSKQVSVRNAVMMTEQILGNQKVDIQDLECTRKMLVTLCNVEDYRSVELELSLANVHLKEALYLKGTIENDMQAHIRKAKKHFSLALKLPGNIALPHYGLFQVAILEQDYLEAYSELHAYASKLGRNSNFQLAYQLLSKLLGIEERVEKGNYDYIQDTSVEYEPLKCNYHLAEQAFLQEDYPRMIKHLSVCESIAKKKKIEIDFSVLMSLANTVFKRYKESQKQKLQLAFANSLDVGERMTVVHKLLALDEMDFEANLLYMDAYIDLKAYNPLVECIQKLKTVPRALDEAETLRLYERLVSEIILESANLRSIHETIDRGEILMEECLYEEVIHHYEKASNQVPFLYFHIKKAEAYYGAGDLESASNCCKRYLDSGYLHYVEAATLLYRIYKEQGENDKALATALECYQKARMKERGTSLNDWIGSLNDICSVQEKQGGFKQYKKQTN